MSNKPNFPQTWLEFKFKKLIQLQKPYYYTLGFQNKPHTSQPNSCRRTANHTGWHECSSFYTFQPGDHIIGQQTGLQKTKKQ